MAEDFVGARIRCWRLKRGLSQKALGELAGMTQGYVSQIEAGLKEIDKRSTLIRVAQALQVSVADLVDVSGLDSPELSLAEAAVPAIRAALNVVRLNEAVEPRRSLDHLVSAVAGLPPLWKAARYDQLSLLMPDLLTDLHSLTAAADERTQRAALRLLVEITHCATATLRHLRCGDLAMIAADVGHAAAVRLGEPTWLGVADYVRLISLPAESKSLTRRLAVEAADRLTGVPASSEALQVAGMLHLSAAYSAASAEQSEETAVHLGEARALARRTGEGNFATMLRTDERRVLGTSIAVAVGEGGRVRELAGTFDPDHIDSATRKAAYFIDFGRGLAQTRRNDAESVASFIRAERLAPQRTRRSRRPPEEAVTRRRGQLRTSRVAKSGRPAQCRCRYEACTVADAKPSGSAPRQAHAAPPAGDSSRPERGCTAVRWNSWPVIRVPATASGLSVSATASR